MNEETMFKIVNEINDALWDLKYNQCNIDTKEKGWETYYGLDDELIKYIRKIEKELNQYKNNWGELKEYLNNGINYWEEQEKEWIEQGFMKFGGEANTKIIYQGILNKMKELEEDK